MPASSNFSEAQLAFDREHLWHPYTSLNAPLPVYPVTGASGVRLTLADGGQLIDGMASWWTAIHGYNHPELNKALEAQAGQMAHVMFGGIPHKPAIELGQKLVDITPEGLDRVFFADSGSVAVEVALKMCVQYQHAKGRAQRAKFLTVSNGYHGDTAGAMSVCDPNNGMHHLFSDHLPKQFFSGALPLGFSTPCDEERLNEIAHLLQVHQNEIAGFIIEPVVQGAGGMRIYNPTYLSRIKALCAEHDVLFVADEIATGFGRTGKLFAMEHAGVAPDILCLGKALTGGYMTLAATVCSKHVADRICAGEAGVFMHGPTFMANPLACAVANRSMELLLDSPWQENVARIEQHLRAQLTPHHRVQDIRVLGAIGVLSCKQHIDVSEAQRYFVDQGVWIRPFRNLVYIMPPYTIGNEDLHVLTNAMNSLLDQDVCFLS